MKRSLGFTLIELLVVIGIIGLLMAALLPLITGGTGAAQKLACQTNLGKIYQLMILHRTNKGHFPTEPGSKFLLSLWTSKTCEHTETMRDLFFCPGIDNNAKRIEINKIPVAELWPRLDNISGDDTDYAGLNTRANNASKQIQNGNVCWAADDNEGGSNHNDGTVNYLMGDGRTGSVMLDQLHQEGTLKTEDTVIPVGEGSPVKALQQVTPR